MPLYTYKCNDCGEITEKVFRISEKPSTITCECGGICETAIIHAPAVHGCQNVPNNSITTAERTTNNSGSKTKSKKFWDYKCPSCETVENFYEFDNDEEHLCKKCQTAMGKVFQTHVVRNDKRMTVGDARKMMKETALQG
jgi:putative FmdB family regulatory protein